jgi:hypothetical protein
VLRLICRSAIKELQIPPANYLEVGMLYDVWDQSYWRALTSMFSRRATPRALIYCVVHVLYVAIYSWLSGR